MNGGIEKVQVRSSKKVISHICLLPLKVKDLDILVVKEQLLIVLDQRINELGTIDLDAAFESDKRRLREAAHKRFRL